MDEDNRSTWAALSVLGIITSWEKFKVDSVAMLIKSSFIGWESLLWLVLFITLPSDMRLFILFSRFPSVISSKSTDFVVCAWILMSTRFDSYFNLTVMAKIFLFNTGNCPIVIIVAASSDHLLLVVTTFLIASLQPCVYNGTWMLNQKR